MFGKRYIEIDDGLDFMIKDTFTNDLIDADDVVDLLNKQNNKIQQLENQESPKIKARIKNDKIVRSIE